VVEEQTIWTSAPPRCPRRACGSAALAGCFTKTLGRVGERCDEQALALAALSSPECLCLPGEVVGALGLVRCVPAVLGELVLEPQRAGAGAGVEWVFVDTRPGSQSPPPARAEPASRWAQADDAHVPGGVGRRAD
jgi:hypothetical protein